MRIGPRRNPGKGRIPTKDQNDSCCESCSANIGIGEFHTSSCKYYKAFLNLLSDCPGNRREDN